MENEQTKKPRWHDPRARTRSLSCFGGDIKPWWHDPRARTRALSCSERYISISWDIYIYMSSASFIYIYIYISLKGQGRLKVQGSRLIKGDPCQYQSVLHIKFVFPMRRVGCALQLPAFQIHRSSGGKAALYMERFPTHLSRPSVT